MATARKHPARSGPTLLTAADVTKWGIRGASYAGGPSPNEPVNETTVARVVAWIQAYCEPMPHTRLNETTVARVVAWIQAYCEPMPHIRRRMDRRGGPLSSYGWKHVAESQRGGIGSYVSNGEFIVAALRAGYRAVPDRPGSPNALFNMRPRPEPRAAACKPRREVRAVQANQIDAMDAQCDSVPRDPGPVSTLQATRSRPTRDGRTRVYVVASIAAEEAPRLGPSTLPTWLRPVPHRSGGGQ